MRHYSQSEPSTESERQSFVLTALILSAFLLAAICGQAQTSNQAVYCATSNDGSVVGAPNPLTTTTVSAMFSGTLPSGTYYVRYTFYTTTGETLASPEQSVQLTETGELTIAIPSSGLPSSSGAVGMNIYIGSAPGAETLQGSTVGTNSFVQSTPLNATSAAPPSVNNTACRLYANDALWPTGTGYNVSITDTHGNTLPGYPMQWQLMGAGTTINLANGLPYYHGVVMYPTPILASPPNHATQSISGGLNLGQYGLTAGSVNSGIFNNYIYPQWFAGVSGDLGKQISIAQTSALCANGCTMILGPGTFVMNTPVVDHTGIRFLGAGMGQTTITCTASSGPLFTFDSVPIEGYGLQDMGFNMTGCLGVGVASLTNSLSVTDQWPILRDVAANYYNGSSCNGTADAFYVSAVGELHAEDMNIVCPGRGIHINGEGGSEDQIKSVNVLSPGTSGIQIDRTTATDIGGYYFDQAKLTNPYNRNMTGTLGACGQFVFNGTAVSGGDVRSPVFITGIGGDHALEATPTTCPALAAVNWDFISTDAATWFGSSSADAVYLSNSIEDKFPGKYTSAPACDYHLDGNVSNDTFANTYQGGNTGYNFCGDTITGATHTHIYGNIMNAAVQMDATTRTNLAVGGDSASGNYDISNSAGSLSVTRDDLGLQSLQGILDASSGCTTDAHGLCQAFFWGVNASDLRWYSKSAGIGTWLMDLQGAGMQLSFFNQPAFNLNVQGSSNILNLGTGSFLSYNTSTHVGSYQNNSHAAWTSSSSTGAMTFANPFSVTGLADGCANWTSGLIGSTGSPCGGSGSPGGSSGQVQWNSSGGFGGIANFTTNGTNPFLTEITKPSAPSSGLQVEYVKAGVGLCTENSSGTEFCPGGAPGGSNTQFQYNNSGSFAGVTNLTSNGTNPIMTVLGSTPSSPSSGYQIPFAKAGVGLCTVDSGGTTYCPGQNPGGSSPQMQYNNGGTFAGIVDWTSNGTDPIMAVLGSVPSNPASGHMTPYAKAGVGICAVDSTGATYCPGGAGSSPGGSTGNVQWNNGGVFGGISNFNSDGTNPQFTVLGSVPTAPAAGLMTAYGVAGVGICAEDSSGNNFCPGGGGGGSTNPAPQYNIPYYSSPGTATTLSGSPGMFTDGSGNLYVGNTSTGPYSVDAVADGSFTSYASPGNLQPFQESGAASVGVCGQAGAQLQAGNCINTNLFQHHEMGGVDNGDPTVYIQGIADTSNAYTGTLGGITGYDTNITYCWIPSASNTSTTPTMAIDGLTAYPIKAHLGATPLAGSNPEFPAGHTICMNFTGSQFEDTAGAPASAGYTWTYTAQTGSYTILSADMSTSTSFGKIETETSSSNQTFTLSGTYGANTYIRVYNTGTAVLSITPSGGISLNGSTSASIKLVHGQGAELRNAGATGFYADLYQSPYNVTSPTFGTSTNCQNSASPAVCAAAPAGMVAIPAGSSPTLVIDTTAVTANSEILLTEDQSLGTALSVTCNTTVPTGPIMVTARSAGTSITIEAPGTFTTNPVCVSYSIIN